MSNRGFDAAAEIRHITAWIREWFSVNGPSASAVIGLSGGKDSTIVAKLLTEALGADRVVGVLMPDGIQADIDDAVEAARINGIRTRIVNIGGAAEALLHAVETAGTATESDESALSQDARINLPPRLRMTALYAVAQSLPGGGRVVNTCNRSEDYIGYSTKYGDAAGDFSPCASYLVTEMLAIGDALGLPAGLVHKAPSDGLCGKTDEDRIGFSYAVLDRYIQTGICEDPTVRERIDRMHLANLHKLKTIPTCPKSACSDEDLIRAALDARGRAYAPYSHYAVGAAVLAEDGQIFTGANVENASYGATNCAERTAVFRAVSEGVRRLAAIAVIGGAEEEHGEMSGEAAPCGICRQVLREFSVPEELDIIIAKSITDYRKIKLSDLLPDSFGPENLKSSM